MMIFSGAVSRFINHHPTIKMLALSFLLLIGTALIADGLHFHIPKGYIYFAMAFSVLVEGIEHPVRQEKTRSPRKTCRVGPALLKKVVWGSPSASPLRSEPALRQTQMPSPSQLDFTSQELFNSGCRGFAP